MGIERELTEAQKLFWERMIASQDGPTTRTKIKAIIAEMVMPELHEIEKNTEEAKNSFNDFWSGVGQMFASRKARKK